MPKEHRKKIALLFLGGSTIDHRGRLGDRVNKPAQVPAWLRQMSEIGIIAETEGVFIDAGIEAIGLDQWIKAGEIISQRYDEFEGFVVIHQLATIAAGGVALSLMLPKLGKPVVLCGSPLDNQLNQPSGKSSASLEFGARANFINAAQLAVSDVAEVLMVYGSHIYRGSSLVGAGDNLAGQLLGKIDFGIQFIGHQTKRTNRPVKLMAKFDRQIMVAEYLAGIDLKQITAVAKHAHALLLSMPDGTNNGPTLIKQLRVELPPRVIIAIYTAGPVTVGDGTIVINGPSRTAAALRLMWALGQTGDRKKIQRMLTA
jgi:L-asparaginase/Glu-tRNA(Gln) amidotransferase subunit D